MIVSDTKSSYNQNFVLNSFIKMCCFFKKRNSLVHLSYSCRARSMKLFNYESGDFVRMLKENHEELGTLKGEKEGWVEGR